MKSARERAGRTMQETADYMGVTRQTVYLWDAGRNMPEASKLLKLAKFYKCSVNALLKNDDTNEESEKIESLQGDG